MNKRIANMWVRALRSGKYTQGTSYLKRRGPHGVQHCCLGVLCELYNKSMKRSGEKGTGEKVLGGITHFGNPQTTATVLPKKVMKWAGITSSEEVDVGGQNLAIMNDGGVSFKKIAGVILKNVEKL